MEGHDVTTLPTSSHSISHHLHSPQLTPSQLSQFLSTSPLLPRPLWPSIILPLSPSPFQRHHFTRYDSTSTHFNQAHLSLFPSIRPTSCDVTTPQPTPLHLTISQANPVPVRHNPPRNLRTHFEFQRMSLLACPKPWTHAAGEQMMPEISLYCVVPRGPLPRISWDTTTVPCRPALGGWR